MEDGISFTRSRRQRSAQRAGSVAAPAKPTHRDGVNTDNTGRASTKSAGPRADSSGGKRKSKDKRKDKSENGSSGALSESLVLADASPPVAAVAGAALQSGAQTAAGGGGRWVHIPT